MLIVLFRVFFLLGGASAVFSLVIHSRGDWGAAEAKNKIFLPDELSEVVITHTRNSHCPSKEKCMEQIKNMQSYYQNFMEWDDIPYNFIIDPEGNIYQGRGWNVMGAESIVSNSTSISIDLLYNDKPTTSQQKALQNLLYHAVLRGQIKPKYSLFWTNDSTYY